MPVTTEIEQLFESALLERQKGNYKAAYELCEQIIAANPSHAAAWHLQGLIQTLFGDHTAAIQLIEQAIRLDRTVAEYHCNLGQCYQRAGRVGDAVNATRQAIAIRPDYGDAFFNLGGILLSQKHFADAERAFRRATELSRYDPLAWTGLAKAMGMQRKLDDAIAAFMTAVELEPWDVVRWTNLALAYERAEKLEPAIRAYQRAAAINPRNAQVWLTLGEALRTMGRAPEAVTAMKRAVTLSPESPDAHNGLAVALGTIGRFKEALDAVQAVLKLDPEHFEGRKNLARVLQNSDRHHDAVAELRRVLAIKPDDVDTRNNLANALHALGQLDEAIAEYRGVLAIRPDHIGAASNLLYSIQFQPATTPQLLRSEHARWREAFEEPLRSRRPTHANSRDPNRRLRIGYVSPDLREHAVAFFMEPILARHDHTQFEVFCYSDAVRTDAVTSRLRRGTDVWINSQPLSDEALAARIAADGIDLLVDLSVHTSGNRLRMFAMKPAPVQLSYLGYCGTTGVDAIDYRITDDAVDPPGVNEAWSTETLIRLPRTFCCFAPPEKSPPVGPLPANKARRITFGAFNSLPKTTDAMLETWARLLREVPDSKLLMLRHAIAEAPVRKRIIDQFAAYGVAQDRLDLRGGVEMQEYFAVLNQVDIALDTSPFNGHTTTCHALWMGVPTVTLVGERPVSRVGASLLRNVGLENLATPSPDAYVAAAAELASRTGQLGAIRKDLRRRMEKSPLMDGPAFVRELEAAYRQAWTTWCTQARDAT